MTFNNYISKVVFHVVFFISLIGNFLCLLSLLVSVIFLSDADNWSGCPKYYVSTQLSFVFSDYESEVSYF